MEAAETAFSVHATVAFCQVPIDFASTSSITSVWSQQLSVSEQDAKQQLYLRMVLHSDYISSDLRFQVKFEGREVADNQVTAHGYADMIGSLDAGSYQRLGAGRRFEETRVDVEDVIVSRPNSWCRRRPDA